jgi:hypothetical protein
VIARQDGVLDSDTYAVITGDHQLPIGLLDEGSGFVTAAKVGAYRTVGAKRRIKPAVRKVADQQDIGRPPHGAGSAGHHQFAVRLLDQGTCSAVAADGGDNLSPGAERAVHPSIRVVAHEQDVVDAIP